MSTDEQSLHPARLADMFDKTPSIPGTPVHSIQTVRRAAAKHDGPLTKILVANRGVSIIFQFIEPHIPTSSRSHNRDELSNDVI